ncbi:oxidoreductase domain protein [Planctopirus limnophila DSM 3776]|uniref:Oxidoreductase domain protein n=1 Tax=Planctopirus limnophila (strain ATCC 43296 / DSM 3776 / IFAM 1008 / Mu 290) TaxID=521674 RepID=D5SWI4_PLAL2|nr:Gfo/Idh/MocA family oxidoreductase [Planctopirus limnophila]ADG69577.1 oxidoreductase domain protein [Planctopirus limnophila DSM 3776]
MQLTPEQERLGKDNFHEAVSFSRRDMLIGAAAAVPGLGAAYFGYQKLSGNPVKVGFIGTGDEGSVLLTQHPAEYMDIVGIADIRPTNRLRALHGDGNEERIGLIKKLGRDKAMSITLYDDHKKLLADPNIEAVVIAVPLCQHYQVALDALNAGKHVLTEKLMCHSVQQCKDLIMAAREKKKLLAVGHQRHYNVLYDNANDLIQKGLLGDIKFIRAQWHRNNSFPGRDSWRKNVPADDLRELTAIAKEKGFASADEMLAKEYGYPSAHKLVNWRIYNDTGAGLMAELGSHQLDAASIFLGKVQPIAVQGYGAKNFYGVKGIGSSDQQADDRDIEDHVYVTFEFPGPHYAEDKNDVCVVTYSSISTNRWEPYGETVFGSRGTLVMKQELEAMLFKESSPSTGGGGVDQRLYVLAGNDGKPVLQASDSGGPSRQAAVADIGKVSRGYTEEMEHFAFCIREGNFGKASEGGLRCPGEQGMKDAIMALTSNLAMKHKKRIVFKPEWFDPASPLVPETDPEIVG